MPCQFISADPDRQEITVIEDGKVKLTSYSGALESPGIADCLPRQVITLICSALARPFFGTSPALSVRSPPR